MKSTILAAMLLTLGTTNASADPMELFGQVDPTSDVQVSGKLGGEFTEQFPEHTFLVGVELRGFTFKDRSTRFFWVSGEATFNEGVVYQNAAHKPDALHVDVSIVPVITEIEQHLNADGGHEASAIRLAPTELKRDLRLGTATSITIRAFGYQKDVEAAIPGNPRLKAFLQTAVDLIGVRYLAQAGYGDSPLFPNATEYHTGIDVGALRVQAGVNWDLTKAIALRLTLAARGDAAIMGANQSDGRIVTAGGEAFARLEFIWRHIFTHWSIFGEAGERAEWEQDAPDFSKSYGFIQVGLAGRYY